MGTSRLVAGETSTGTRPALPPPPPLPLPFLPPPPPPPPSASDVVDELHPAKASMARITTAWTTGIRGRVRDFTGITFSIQRRFDFVHLHNGRVNGRVCPVTFS